MLDCCAEHAGHSAFHVDVCMGVQFVHWLLYAIFACQVREGASSASCFPCGAHASAFSPLRLFFSFLPRSCFSFHPCKRCCSRVRRPAAAAAVPRQLLRRFFCLRARSPVACRLWRRFSVCREMCAPEGICTLELAPRAHRCFLRVGFLRFEPAHFVR